MNNYDHMEIIVDELYYDHNIEGYLGILKTLKLFKPEVLMDEFDWNKMDFHYLALLKDRPDLFEEIEEISCLTSGNLESKSEDEVLKELQEEKAFESIKYLKD